MLLGVEGRDVHTARWHDQAEWQKQLYSVLHHVVATEAAWPDRSPVLKSLRS
jgi:hypothetical protein